MSLDNVKIFLYLYSYFHEGNGTVPVINIIDYMTEVLGKYISNVSPRIICQISQKANKESLSSLLEK